MYDDVRPAGAFDRAEVGRSHVQVVVCRDESTGLKVIISIHDTTHGPALGGTRFYPYGSEAEALTDGLRLAEENTYKGAAASLPLGGGKPVIIGDPARDKSPELLRSYVRFIERLGGWHVTAADLGRRPRTSTSSARPRATYSAAPSAYATSPTATANSWTRPAASGSRRARRPPGSSGGYWPDRFTAHA